MTDPYSVLGVTRDASDEEITRAYRALARKFHPDLNPGNKRAEAEMKNLNAAYMQIQDIRSGKSYRHTEGWGGMDDASAGDASTGNTHPGGGYYGGYYNPYGGFYNGGYNADRSGPEQNGRTFYTFRRRRSPGLFGFPFIRIILAIIVLRFVLGIIVTLLVGPIGYNDYSPRRESDTAQINVSPAAQSGAEEWVVL